MCIQPDPFGDADRAPGEVLRKVYESIGPAVWDRPDMLDALAVRDVAAVYRLLQKHGVSQRQIAALTGQSQSEISEILGGRKVVAYDVLVRIAQGLGVDRGLMGLAYVETSNDGGDIAGGGNSVVRHRPAELEHRDRSDAVPPSGGRRAERDAGLVVTWTGADIRALRQALRMSVRDFGRYLGVSGRIVSKWEAIGSTVRPRPFSQGLLDTALERASAEAKERFGELRTAP